MNNKVGKQITSVEEALESGRKSVYDKIIGKVIPVAFIQNYQTRYLLTKIKAGHIYEYNANKNG